MLRLLYNLLIFSLLPLSCWGSSLLNSLISAVKVNEELENLGIPILAIRPDPFVAASPLIVAAVCSDGIALVATHTASSGEKLLREVVYEKEEEEEEEEGEGNQENKKAEGQEEDEEKTIATTRTPPNFATIWKDLPSNHGGPYRINNIDRCGTHLLSAGWRADCDLLIERIRSLASQEVAVFGKPRWGLPYGRMLAQETSLWMAQVAVSGSRRPLSCVGLLAACGGQERETELNASLWYVDMTGAYRVRALATGGGPAEAKVVEKEEEESFELVAQLVNAELEKTDFSTMTAREGAVHILNILCGKTSTTSTTMEDGATATTPFVPAGCEMEVACISPTNLQRLKLSELSTSF